MATIIWTRTDEAPLLATYSLKPIVEAFAAQAGIDVETRDISLAGASSPSSRSASTRTSVSTMSCPPWASW